MAEDHRPPQGSVIDAWADGLGTRLVTAQLVTGYRGELVLLSEWRCGAWVPAGSISRTASWRLSSTNRPTG